MTAPHPMNPSRAERAREVVEAFGSITGAEVYQEAAGDLICDIGHLCDEEGLDFVAIVRKAVAYWKIEQTDAEGMSAPPHVDLIIEDTGGSS